MSDNETIIVKEAMCDVLGIAGENTVEKMSSVHPSDFNDTPPAEFHSEISPEMLDELKDFDVVELQRRFRDAYCFPNLGELWLFQKIAIGYDYAITGPEFPKDADFPEDQFRRIGISEFDIQILKEGEFFLSRNSDGKVTCVGFRGLENISHHLKKFSEVPVHAFHTNFTEGVLVDSDGFSYPAKCLKPLSEMSHADVQKEGRESLEYLTKYFGSLSNSTLKSVMSGPGASTISKLIEASGEIQPGQIMLFFDTMFTGMCDLFGFHTDAYYIMLISWARSVKKYRAMISAKKTRMDDALVNRCKTAEKNLLESSLKRFDEMLDAAIKYQTEQADTGVLTNEQCRLNIEKLRANYTAARAAQNSQYLAAIGRINTPMFYKMALNNEIFKAFQDCLAVMPLVIAFANGSDRLKNQRIPGFKDHDIQLSRDHNLEPTWVDSIIPDPLPENIKEFCEFYRMISPGIQFLTIAANVIMEGINTSVFPADGDERPKLMFFGNPDDDDEIQDKSAKIALATLDGAFLIDRRNDPEFSKYMKSHNTSAPNDMTSRKPTDVELRAAIAAHKKPGKNINVKFPVPSMLDIKS